MATKTHFNNLAAALAVALAFSGVALVAHAASVFDITYPIAELGGCADRVACKAYCDDSANQSACTAFAREYGLTVQTQSAPAPQSAEQIHNQSSSSSDSQLQAIQAAIAQDGGPGGCGTGASDPVSACRDYCDASANIQACVAYATTHNIMSGERLQEAQKVAAALANGVSLPAGCTDAQSCQKTCQDPSSLDQAKSCFSFAKAAGILPPNFNEVAAEKIFSTIKDGSSPFSSMKDFQKCQNPTDSAIIKTCTDFAVQNGLMTQEQAQTLQQTGGKGPGDCQGKDACDAYCAKHQDECFQFAQDHNLVTPEQQSQMKHAAAQMQDALSRAPDAVKQCISSAVGQDTLDAITAGTKPGSPEIGQKMQTCFGQHQNNHQSEGQQGPPPPGMEQGGTGPQFGNDNGVTGPRAGAPGEPPPQQEGQPGMPPGTPVGPYSNGSYNPTGQYSYPPPPSGGDTGNIQPPQYPPQPGAGVAPSGSGQLPPPPQNTTTAPPPSPPPPAPTSFLGGISQTASAIFSFLLGRSLEP